LGLLDLIFPYIDMKLAYALRVFYIKGYKKYTPKYGMPFWLDYSVQMEVLDSKLFWKNRLLEKGVGKDSIIREIEDTIESIVNKYAVDKEEAYTTLSFFKILNYEQYINKSENIKLETNLHIHNRIQDEISEAVLAIEPMDGVKPKFMDAPKLSKYLCPEEYFEELIKELKEMRGQYINLEKIEKSGIKIHSVLGLDFVFIPFEDYIHIQWDCSFRDLVTNDELDGQVKVYRRERSFAEDRFSSIDNGDLIADSAKKRFAFADEDLDPNISYCYTINYFVPTEVSKGMFKKENVIKIHHITRERLKLCKPTSAVVVEEKSEIEIIKEQKQKKLELEKINLTHKKEKLFVNLKEHIKTKEDGATFLEDYRKKLVADKLKNKKYLNQTDKTEIADEIEKLEDRLKDLMLDYEN